LGTINNFGKIKSLSCGSEKIWFADPDMVINVYQLHGCGQQCGWLKEILSEIRKPGY
jgi:hypothetical protein